MAHGVESLTYILPLTASVYIPSNFSDRRRKTFLFLPYQPFKIINNIGANRKRVCDFLLVRNSNLGLILHCFGATARFMCSYSTLILGVFPLHQIAHVGSASAWVLSYLAVKLLSKNSNLCAHGT